MTAAFQIYRGEPSERSLQAALDRLVVPDLRRFERARDTIQSYRRYCRAWTSFWVENSGEMAKAWLARCGDEDGTTCPVLPQSVDEITVEHLEIWRDFLLARKLDGGAGFSNRNVNKYLGGVESILAKCAVKRWLETAPGKLPRLPQRSAAEKLYFRFLTRPQTDRLNCLLSGESLQEKRELAELREKDELSRLYRAASGAWWPSTSAIDQPLDPVRQWQAAIVMWCVYGFRTEELIQYTPDADPLSWARVHWESATPAIGFHAENSSGWFYYVPAKQKRAKPEPLVLPLAPVAARHLKAIKPSRLDASRPVFDWPRSNRSFYSQWHSLAAAAGLKPCRDLRTGKALPMLPKHLRKTCVTWHNYHMPGMGALITGHAPREMVARHYDNPELSIIEAVNSLPVPEAWNAADPPRNRQTFLF